MVNGLETFVYSKPGLDNAGFLLHKLKPRHGLNGPT